MYIIGIDTHAATCTAAVVTPTGKVSRCQTVATSMNNLIELVSRVRCPRTVVIEENGLAQWVSEGLTPHVDQVVVSDPRQNRLIAKAEFIDDRRSAIQLAQLLRGGYISAVRHGTGPGAQRRALFIDYYDWMHQVARFKNKLASLFLQVAIPLPEGRYDPSQRDRVLALLRAYPVQRHQAARLLAVLPSLQAAKDKAGCDVVTAARQVKPTFELLDGMPGCGELLAAGYIALIETPYRFSVKNKLWSYAGFSNTRHESAGVVYRQHSTAGGNRPLKWVVSQQFNHAVDHSKEANRFKRAYAAAVARGLPRAAARRHVCRMILSVVRGLWMKGEPYHDAL